MPNVLKLTHLFEWESSMRLQTITDKETIARKTFHARIAWKVLEVKIPRKSKELYLMKFFHSIIIFAALCFLEGNKTKKNSQGEKNYGETFGSKKSHKSFILYLFIELSSVHSSMFYVQIEFLNLC